MQLLLLLSIANAEPERFGDQGVVALGGDLGTRVAPLESYWFTNVSPTVVVFVVRGLGIGADLDTALYLQLGETSYAEASLGIGPTLGYDVRLGRRASFFPQLRPAIGGSLAVVGGESLPANRWLKLGLRAPFLFHFDNYYLGIGPFGRVVVSSRSGEEGFSQSLSVGLGSTVGGWF